MVTSGTLAKRRWRFFTIYSLLWRNGCPTCQKLSQPTVSICWAGQSCGPCTIFQESQVAGWQSCCQHKVCHRTFIQHVRCESIPPLLASPIHGEYTTCCGVERPQVCWKGLSTLTRSCIPTKVGSWELSEKKIFAPNVEVVL
jgi:hypothetical protein